jgi:pimeloyl-ACP methyl ester carboxylesterase
MSRPDPEGVEIAGPNNAQEIVFVHGTVFNRTMWVPQREALSREFRVITPDLPGHGTRADEPFRMETAVETLDGIFEDLIGESAHLVGLSLGGYVATEFARRRPEKVDDLILSSSSANPVGILGTLSRVVGRATILASKSGLVERATDWLTERYVRSRELRPAVADEIVDAGFDLRPFGEAGVEIADEDFRTAFASFSGPALVLNGKWDLVMRLGEGDHASAKGDAEVQVIDGAGHVCNLDRPGVYASAVEHFVNSTVDVDAD